MAPSRLELEPLSAYWQQALDAADKALWAATGSVPDDDLRERRQHLVRERQQTARLLEAVARVARPPTEAVAVAGSRTKHDARPPRGRARLHLRPRASPYGQRCRACLGMGRGLRRLLAALLAADGLALHPLRPRRRLPVVPRRTPETRRRPRVLAEPRDPAPRRAGPTTHRRRKRRMAWPTERARCWRARLRERGVTESLGARRYLEAAHRAGVKCAAISASANTSKVLELSGLAALIDVRIDAEVMRSECLRSLPAPDVLLAACRRLEVLPAEAATFTCSPAGVAAGTLGGSRDHRRRGRRPRRAPGGLRRGAGRAVTANSARSAAPRSRGRRGR